jgi:hypothetical protein
MAMVIIHLNRRMSTTVRADLSARIIFSTWLTIGDNYLSPLVILKSVLMLHFVQPWQYKAHICPSLIAARRKSSLMALFIIRSERERGREFAHGQVSNWNPCDRIDLDNTGFWCFDIVGDDQRAWENGRSRRDRPWGGRACNRKSHRHGIHGITSSLSSTA